MKINCGLAVLVAFFFSACQPTNPTIVTILENDRVIQLQTDERVPLALLTQAGLTFNANDRVLVNGLPAAVDQPISISLITSLPLTVQIRHAINLTLITPDGQRPIQSSAFNVGEALQQESNWLREENQIQPDLNSPIKEGMTITISLPQNLTISTDGKSLQIESSVGTVGEALAQAGIPLLGLDYSIPAENESLPLDGQIKVVRVQESVLLSQKPIPFDSDLQASAEVPLDQTQILQPGEMGLSVQRVRIRYEDGKEISRLSEDETVVRPPKIRIMAYGTKIEIKTAVVNGVHIEYWRSMQMYATSYSPCRLGTSTCGSTTASGKNLHKGIIAVNRSWYYNMLGQQLFIPGYGRGAVADLCPGCVGKPWIDLGFTDANFEPWHQWVTVYFLTPVPANIIYVLE